MSAKIKRSSGKKIKLYIQLFFRHFPAIPFIGKWLCICSIIGICAGSASAGFLQSLDWVSRFRESYIRIIALLPVGGFAVGLLYYYYGRQVEAGNNLLLDTINQPGPTIPLQMAPFVYIGTIITHLLGGSAGREGTALQMAGSIADQFTKPFRLGESERKILLIAAIAAGFGSVFGTPLAGAVFALEVFLIGRIRYDAIFPAFLSAILANLVTGLWHTHHTQYHMSAVPPLAVLPVFYTLVCGVAFGICAAAFSKGIHFTGAIFKSRIAYAPLRPLAGGVIVALAVWAMGTTRYIGLGIPVILQSFDQPFPAYDFAIKMAFTIVTLAAGFKGGEVTPLFFIGAALGSALAHYIPLPVDLLAGIGFVAVFAGATNTPLACTLMAMELFGSACGIYAAIACVVAYLLSGHNSIYGRQMIGEPKHTRFSHHQGRNLSDL